MPMLLRMRIISVLGGFVRTPRTPPGYGPVRMSYIYKGVDTVGAEGTEVPTVSSSHGLCAYAQVVAYGSDALCDPV